MDRNLALELVRVTEAAAIAAAKWFGKGDKHAADQAAVDEMRDRFNAIDMQGEIIIGEGEKDKAPMLFIGEKVGTQKGLEVDIAVDPLECTTHCAEGKPNSMSMVAIGQKGSLAKLPGTYSDQLVVGSQAKEVIDITKPLEQNLKAVAQAMQKPLDQLTVAILNRPRHKKRIELIRSLGCRVWLFEHGSLAAGLATCDENHPIDVMTGINGAPEGVIMAAALQCLGGNTQQILRPHKDEFKQQAVELGIKENQVLTINDLAKGPVMFVATGVSPGPLLDGVTFHKDKIMTHSVVMRSKTKTIRHITATHNLKN